MNVRISEEARLFVASEVASGRYASEEAVVEDALNLMRRHAPSAVPDAGLASDPLWGLFRDEPELIDQIVQDAMSSRRTMPLRATDHE